MPITWKNVGQTMGSNTAAHMFDGAVDNVTGGLDRIRNAIGQVQEGRAEEHEFNVDKNTSAYFDALQQYQTPEELAAARESGALARLRQGFDGVVDEDRIRGAAGERIKSLRTDQMAEQQYELGQAQESAQEPYNRLLELAQTNPDQAKQWYEENSDVFANARMTDQAMGAIFDGEAAIRGREAAERAENERKWEETTRSVIGDFARTDGDYNSNKEAAIAALEKANVPSHFYQKYLGEFRANYLDHRDIAPEVQHELEAVEQTETAQAEHRVRLAEIELERELAAVPLNPDEPWNGETVFGEGDVRAIIEEENMDEGNFYRAHFVPEFHNAIRSMAFAEGDSGPQAVKGDEIKSGDPYEMIPDDLRDAFRRNEHAIMADAARGLERAGFTDWGDWWGKRNRGGDDTLRGVFQDSIERWVLSERDKLKRERVQKDYERKVSDARQTASQRINYEYNRARLAAGYNVQEMEDPQITEERENSNRIRGNLDRRLEEERSSSNQNQVPAQKRYDFATRTIM